MLIEKQNSVRRCCWSIFIPLEMEIDFPNHGGNVRSGIDSLFVFQGIQRFQLVLCFCMLFPLISRYREGEMLPPDFVECSNDPKMMEGVFHQVYLALQYCHMGFCLSRASEKDKEAS